MPATAASAASVLSQTTVGSWPVDGEDSPTVRSLPLDPVASNEVDPDDVFVEVPDPSVVFAVVVSGVGSVAASDPVRPLEPSSAFGEDGELEHANVSETRIAKGRTRRGWPEAASRVKREKKNRAGTGRPVGMRGARLAGDVPRWPGRHGEGVRRGAARRWLLTTSPDRGRSRVDVHAG